MVDQNITLPCADEAAAHMYPWDIEKFQSGEHTATAFSIAVGCPDGESVPLFTLEQVRAAVALDRQGRGEPASAESRLQTAGVFKGAEGLRRLANADSFWSEQPYSTRLYFGDGAADYLHRDVLRAAINVLDAPQPAEPDVLPGEAVFGFSAWLTSLKTPVTFSECHGAAIGADLAVAYNKSQGFDKIREDFHRRLKPYPEQEPAQPAEPVKGPSDEHLIETGCYQTVIERHSQPAASAEPVAHTDDDAVDRFAAAMKDKLAQARAKGRHGWQECDPSDLSQMLRAHVEKGDPRDVANFCMFLWSLGQPISAAPVAQEPVAIPEGWRGVPVEPTEEMLTAGVPKNAVLDPGTALMFRNGRISTWKHMVGAAPAAPVAAQPSVPEPLKYGGKWKDHYVTGWNNCRAAMLGASPTPTEADPKPTPEEEEQWRQTEAAQARADRIFDAAKK